MRLQVTLARSLPLASPQLDPDSYWPIHRSGSPSVLLIDIRIVPVHILRIYAQNFRGPGFDFFGEGWLNVRIALSSIAEDGPPWTEVQPGKRAPRMQDIEADHLDDIEVVAISDVYDQG